MELYTLSSTVYQFIFVEPREDESGNSDPYEL